MADATAIDVGVPRPIFGSMLMGRITVITMALLTTLGCTKDKSVDPSSAEVGLTLKSLSDGPTTSADPAWNRPSGKRFVSVRTDILMNSCQTPALNSADAALVDESYGRFAALGGAFGDQKAAPGTLGTAQLTPCAEGKTTTAAEFVFLVPDNLDATAASLSFRGASASLTGLKKL
jgi:hypothetical protein